MPVFDDMDFSQYGTPSEEWKEFAKTNPLAIGFMPDKENTPPAELQAQVNEAVKGMNKAKLDESGLWNVVESEDYVATGRDGNDIAIRRYRPKAANGKTLPTYIYFHGGGYIFGSLDADEPLCVAWAHTLSMAVVSINYRHTPQASGPSAWHDAIDGFEWVMSNTSKLGVDPAKITVGGISAGASLAAGVTVHDVRKSRETGSPLRVKGQILAIPVLMQEVPYHLFADKEKTSRVQCAGSAVLSKDWLDYFTGMLHANTDVPLSHPTWNPGLTEMELLPYMPPTAFLVSGADVLRDDGLFYATRLKEAG